MAAVTNHPALIARKRAGLDRIRTTTGIAVARIWTAMPNHAADTQDAFARQATPVVKAGQDRAVSLTVAFIAALTGITAKTDRPAIIGSAAVDLTSPFKAFGHALNDGQDINAALAAGADAARSAGQDAVTWASRSSGTAFDHSDQVIGWERIPDGGACDWCVLVAGQTYKTADTAAFGHRDCGCEASPLTQDRPQGYEASSALYAAQKASA